MDREKRTRSKNSSTKKRIHEASRCKREIKSESERKWRRSRTYHARGSGRSTGPATASTDGDGGDGGVHEQDANAESGAEGGEAASWRSNRIEKAREDRTGMAVQ